MPPPPLLKFLAAPRPSLVVGEENLVTGFAPPPHFRNASAIARFRLGLRLLNYKGYGSVRVQFNFGSSSIITHAFDKSRFD